MNPIQLAYDELPLDNQVYGKHNRSEDCIVHALLRTPGEKSLCVAIIEHAVMDYFILVRRGAIKEGHLTGKYGEKRQKNKSKSTGEHYMTHTVNGMTANEMRELINFLQYGVARLSDICEFSLSVDCFFERILHLERTGNYTGSQQRRERATYATARADKRRRKNRVHQAMPCG